MISQCRQPSQIRIALMEDPISGGLKVVWQLMHRQKANHFVTAKAPYIVSPMRFQLRNRIQMRENMNLTKPAITNDSPEKIGIRPTQTIESLSMAVR